MTDNLKVTNILYTNHIALGVTSGVMTALLLYSFDQPMVITTTISLLFFLIMFTLSLLFDFMSNAIGVDRSLEKTERKNFFFFLNRLVGVEEAITKHLLKHAEDNT